MSTRTWLIVGLAVSLALNVAVVGAFIAHRVTRSPRPVRALLRHPEPRMHEEMRAMHREFADRMDSLRQELTGSQRELTLLLRDAEASDEQIEALAQDIGRAHATMTRFSFEFTRAMLQKLPPEQQEKLLHRFEHQYDRPQFRGRGPRRFGRPGRRGRRQRREFDTFPPGKPGEPPPRESGRGGE